MPLRLVLLGMTTASASLAAAQEMPPPKPKAVAPAPAARPEPKPAGNLKLTTPPKRAGGSDMVAVPGGSFRMGCNEAVDTECDANEKPARTVQVAAFRIDRTEVTVADYRRCADAGQCTTDGVTMPYWDGKEQPDYGPQWCTWGKSGRERHPMNCVDWHQATAYCTWRGARLPTEAEWEKAARGTDGQKYPWGNAGYGQAGRVANIADESAWERYPNLMRAEGYDDGYVGTAPVGSFPAGESPYGALDMVGNVWEWVASPGRNDEVRGVRGGSWSHGPKDARVSRRDDDNPRGRRRSVGFRCAE